MTQKEIEAKLTQLQEENPQNPEIYELLVKLVSNMLRSQNWLLAPIDFDNVSHDVAADLFMNVYTGKYHVTYWRAMAYRMIMFCHVKKQRKIAMTQCFETNYDPTRREAIFRTCTSYQNTYEQEAAQAENKVYLSQAGHIIEEVMKESKFDSNSPEYLSLYTSVALTLLHGEEKYFHLDESLYPYVKIFVQQVKERIYNSGIFTSMREFDIFLNPLYNTALMPDLNQLDQV